MAVPGETKDYIGGSRTPGVAWVRRLRDVAEGSSFPQEAKDVIESRLSDLQQELRRLL
jgi:hypothetical protein